MENVKLTCTKQGLLFYHGLNTGFFIETAEDEKQKVIWYLQRPRRAHKQFAKFNCKKDVLQAAIVFIEGVTQCDDESEMQAVLRALQACLETGSSNVMKLTK